MMLHDVVLQKPGDGTAIIVILQNHNNIIQTIITLQKQS